MKDFIKVTKLRAVWYIVYSVLIALGVVLDQLTKYFAETTLTPNAPQPFIKGILNFTLHYNRGAAFGMLQNHRYVFMIVSTIMILGLSAVIFLGITQNLKYSLPIALIISGGIGNMIDRIAYGYVIDFLDLAFMKFAIFNVADSIVCIGAALLAFFVILDTIKEEIKAKRNKTTNEKGDLQE